MVKVSVELAVIVVMPLMSMVWTSPVPAAEGVAALTSVTGALAVTSNPVPESVLMATGSSCDKLPGS